MRHAPARKASPGNAVSSATMPVASARPAGTPICGQLP